MIIFPASNLNCNNFRKVLTCDGIELTHRRMEERTMIQLRLEQYAVTAE